MKQISKECREELFDLLYTGKKWNRIIYGKNTIYVNNKKVLLSDNLVFYLTLIIEGVEIVSELPKIKLHELFDSTINDSIEDLLKSTVDEQFKRLITSLEYAINMKVETKKIDKGILFQVTFPYQEVINFDTGEINIKKYQKTFLVFNEDEVLKDGIWGDWRDPMRLWGPKYWTRVKNEDFELSS